MILRAPPWRFGAFVQMRNLVRSRVKEHFRYAVVLVVLLAPVFSARSAGQAAFQAHGGGVQPPARETPMPFRAGETLDYTVSWAAFSTAASVQLSVPEQRNLFGWQAWHFRAVVHTLSHVRTLFEVDDQFDSYTDAGTLESRQFELHLNEMGGSSDQVLHLGQSSGRSRQPGPIVLVLPGTRDPLGALYSLRGVNWQTVPEFRATVYDGSDVYEMRAQRDAADESVRVPAGSFSASRVSIRVFQFEKEVSLMHFVVWLANDAAHTPVVMQATLPLGNLRAELLAPAK